MEKPTISQREAQILQLVSEGLSTFQIADLLFISPHTVNTHRKNILRKLRVNNSMRAITMYLSQQIAIQYGGELKPAA